VDAPKPIKMTGWSLSIDDQTTSVTHQDVLNYFEVVWGQADTYWKEKVLPDWEKNMRLYQDNYGLPFHRYNWQSQLKDPVVDNLVTRISYFMQKTLVNVAIAGNYFTVRHHIPERAKAYEELLRLDLRSTSYPKKFTESFSKSLVQAVMAHKIVYAKRQDFIPVFDQEKERWTTLKPETRGEIQVVTIDPKNIRLDPYGDEFIIEICPRVPLHEFKMLARVNKWVNTKQVLETVEQQLKHNALPTVTLKYVYTKCLLSPSGKELSPYIHFIVVNDAYVVHLENYILPNGDFPYSVANPMMDISGRYGRSYVSKIHDLVTHYVGFTNLMLDSAYLSALGVHEYDAEVATSDTAHSATSGITPGKMYTKHGSTPMLHSSFPPSNLTSSLLQVGFFLDRELQNKGWVNEFFSGQATSKGRPTLGEVNLKTQESTAFFTDMGAHVESTKISEDFRLILTTRLMHMHSHKDDFKRFIEPAPPEVKEVLNSLTVEDIRADLVDMRVEVTGVSGKIQRMANFNRYLQIWQVIGNMPLVQASTLFTKLIRKLFEILDDRPEEIVDMADLEQLQTMMREAQKMQIQQAVQQPQPAPQTGTGQPGQSQPAGAV